MNLFDDDDNIIKLNARGHIIFVDGAILMKSNYFNHIIFGDGFMKSELGINGTYYVDCDSDVMIELIAYMETGYFKYNKINSSYMKSMLDKYGIEQSCNDKEKDAKIKKEKENINMIYDALVCYVAGIFKSNFILTNEFEKLEIKALFIPLYCENQNINIIKLSEKNDMFGRGQKYIEIGCRYNNELCDLRKLKLEKCQVNMMNLLEKYDIDEYVYVNDVYISPACVRFTSIMKDKKTVNNELDELTSSNDEA